MCKFYFLSAFSIHWFTDFLELEMTFIHLIFYYYFVPLSFIFGCGSMRWDLIFQLDISNASKTNLPKMSGHNEDIGYSLILIIHAI